jgi:hypothetical protein
MSLPEVDAAAIREADETGCGLSAAICVAFPGITGNAVARDKEVYNGDIGYIDDVDPDADEPKARFDGRVVTYGSASSTHWCRPMP